MDTIKLGIVGCGIMGTRILNTVLDNPDLGVGLAGILEPSEKRRGELASERHDLPFVPDMDALVAASDCIYIATPPATHLALARQAMAAGKAIFTEKPLSVSMDDSEAFLREVRAKNAPAAVNFIFASSPAVARLKNWISSGRIGEAQKLEITTRFAQWPRDWQMGAHDWLDGRAEGGFTREVVSHLLFLTRRFIGPMSDLTAKAVFDNDDGTESGIEATFRAGGLPVSLTGDVGQTDQSDHNLWHLTGSKGAVRLRDWSTAELLSDDGKTWLTDPDALPHADMRPVILKGQVSKLPALIAGEKHDLATIEEALDVQRIVEAILNSGEY